jgi:hypothetical protein
VSGVVTSPFGQVRLIPVPPGRKMRSMPRRICDPKMVASFLAKRERHGWPLSELSQHCGAPVGISGTWAERAKRSRCEADSRRTPGYLPVRPAEGSSERDHTLVRLRRGDNLSLELRGEAAIMMAAWLWGEVPKCF